MGLQLTLDKTKNKMYHTFTDAYWSINEVFYTTDMMSFALHAYPSREAKLMEGKSLENPSINFGSGDSSVSSMLYTWRVNLPITDVFPDGLIPVGKEVQYTTIYNWIKEYTELPFTDVFEEEELTEKREEDGTAKMSRLGELCRTPETDEQL